MIYVREKKIHVFMLASIITSTLDFHYNAVQQRTMYSHYNDVIMGSMASQITSLTIAYSAVYLGADLRKHQSSASLAFVSGELPAQMASNAENVSIWWRHHVQW